MSLQTAASATKVCLLLFFALFSAACASETWERYAIPDYSPTRADRICHPYTHCK